MCCKNVLIYCSNCFFLCQLPGQQTRTKVVQFMQWKQLQTSLSLCFFFKREVKIFCPIFTSYIPINSRPCLDFVSQCLDRSVRHRIHHFPFGGSLFFSLFFCFWPAYWMVLIVFTIIFIAHGKSALFYIAALCVCVCGNIGKIRYFSFRCIRWYVAEKHGRSIMLLRMHYLCVIEKKVERLFLQHPNRTTRTIASNIVPAKRKITFLF